MKQIKDIRVDGFIKEIGFDFDETSGLFLPSRANYSMPCFDPDAYYAGTVAPMRSDCEPVTFKTIWEAKQSIEAPPLTSDDIARLRAALDEATRRMFDWLPDFPPPLLKPPGTLTGSEWMIGHMDFRPVTGSLFLTAEADEMNNAVQRWMDDMEAQ